jgi:diaminopimelate decarboxylase
LGNVYYPLKANSNQEIIKTLKPLINNTNNGFLISYLSHYKTLRDHGINPKNICLMNVLMDDDSIKYLYNEGVRFFTFDNLQSLNEFSKYANLEETKVNIRISSMNLFENVFSHLGTSLSECFDMIRFLNDKCKNIGVSFYLNKDVKNDENCLYEMLGYIVENFKERHLHFLNIGGVKSYKQINADYIKDIKEKLGIDCINFEPGEYLLNNVVDMVSPIIRVKNINNQKVVIIKNGIYSGFFDKLLYKKDFEFYFQSKIDGNVKVEHNQTKNKKYGFLVCGGSSDSGDILGSMFIEDKYKDELVVGSSFYVKNVGSYFEEFFMPYSDDLNKIYISEEYKQNLRRNVL